MTNMSETTLVTAEGSMSQLSGAAAGCVYVVTEGAVSTLSEHLAEGSSRPRPCHGTGLSSAVMPEKTPGGAAEHTCSSSS